MVIKIKMYLSTPSPFDTIPYFEGQSARARLKDDQPYFAEEPITEEKNRAEREEKKCTDKWFDRAGLPICFKPIGKQNITDFHGKLSKLNHLDFYKTVQKLHHFEDAELCILARDITARIQTETGADGCTERMARRKLRTACRQSIEQLAHNLGMVGQGKKWLRCTLSNQQARSEQIYRNKKAIEKMTFHVDGQKEPIRISDVRRDARKNQANEIFCTLRGMEQIGVEQGLDWAMLTLTASPSHHPSARSYGGGSMLSAAKEIEGKLRNINRELHREKVQISGCRTLEFHRDGCPHIHLVVFYRKDDKQKIQDAVAKRFTLTHDRDSHGTEGRPTANWQDGDSTKSRPSSYAMKYVLKSLFAADEKKQSDEERQLDSLYSTWNLRRFSFFGLPSRTTWREARKLKSENIPPKFHIIRVITNYATVNNAAEFIKKLGGMGIKNSERPAKISIIDCDGYRKIVMREKINNVWESADFNREKHIILVNGRAKLVGLADGITDGMDDERADQMAQNVAGEKKRALTDNDSRNSTKLTKPTKNFGDLWREKLNLAIIDLLYSKFERCQLSKEVGIWLQGLDETEFWA